jgi:hypothetical protein
MKKEYVILVLGLSYFIITYIYVINCAGILLA